MNSTKLISMEDLFHIAGYDFKKLNENEWVDISEKNIKIKSYNHLKNEVEMKKILKLVRKQDSIVYYVKLKSGEDLFKCTSAHKVFLEDKKEYVEIGNLKSFFGLNSVNQKIECLVEKSNEVYPILDIEVEGNKNYFSNGILSHNTTTGGNALKYYASLRFEIARKETLKNGEESIGVKTRIKIVKNKVAPPFTECTFDLIFKEGYDYEGSIIEEAVRYDIIQKGGAWYTYKGEKFQGSKGLKEFLKKTPEVIQELREQVLQKVKESGITDKEVIVEEEIKKRQVKQESKEGE